MKVVIIGGLGFIGHQVVAQLIKQGHQVDIIDPAIKKQTSNRAELKELYKQRVQIASTSTLHFTSFSSQRAYHLIEEIKPDLIIFMPGPANQKQAGSDPQKTIHIMVTELYNFLHHACMHTNRIVYVSSSMVYGDFSEPVAETATLTPTGIYAISKTTGEMLVRDITKQYGIEHVIVRPSAVYGPLDTTDRVIGRFLLKALNDETLTVNGANEMLDFTYVDDAASGIVLAGTVPLAANRTYNITRGVAVSLYEAATAITQLVGTGKVEVVDRDSTMPSRNALNIDRARLDLGFDPQVNFDQGIKRYYDWLITSTCYLG
jgi:nucleoside-diphosphate-sugar epimerase